MKTKVLLLLLVITTSINAQFTENFDNYNLGTVLYQNPDLWSTWSGYAEPYSQLIIDNAQSVSGSQAGYVGPDYVTDAFLLLGNKISGQWNLTFQMYIPTNKSGYFNIQGALSEIGGVSNPNEFLGGNVSFNQDNTSAGVGTLNSINFNFPHDTWFSIELIFDVDNKTFQLKVNNSIVNITPIDFENIQNTTTQIEVLGAIDFFSASATNEYWIDDIVYTGSSIHTFIPDDNFEQALIDIGLDSNLDNKFITADLPTLTSINLDNKNINNLVGINAMTNLQTLSCSGNNITRLDLRGNTQLTAINCSNNSISGLIFTDTDLSNKNSNNTTNLTGFQSLDCSNNALTALDLTNNTALTVLNCSNNNQLTSLNIQNGVNTNLTSFDATNNPLITCIFVDDVTYSTANWPNIDTTSTFVANQTECENIVTYVPDDWFEYKLILAGYDDVYDDYVKTINIRAVGNLDLSNNNMTNLTGIEDFAGLKNLNISTNVNLGGIDVTNNKFLKVLNVQDTALTSLDVSQNEDLVSLNCYFNNLTSLDISQNTELEILNCNLNDIPNLDVSQNNNLTSLSCYGNNFINLNISNLTNLTYLMYGNTSLGNMDLSQNVNLETLYALYVNTLDITANSLLSFLGIYYSNIPNIDLSQHGNLTSLNLYDNDNLINIDLSQNTMLNDLFCTSSDNLITLDLRNGNNTNFVNFNANFNPLLTCIYVDDAGWSQANWTNVDTAVSTFIETNAECSTLLSIDDEALNEVITIYPNPANDIITIKTKDNAVIDNITIYNSLGKKVKTSNQNIMNIGNLEKGIYLVVITDNDGKIARKKILKN